MPYPHEAGWKPAFTISDAAPPPLSVGGIHYFDDIPSFEAQFLVIHGDMVPQGFSTDHTAITDELRREPCQAVRAQACPGPPCGASRPPLVLLCGVGARTWPAAPCQGFLVWLRRGPQSPWSRATLLLPAGFLCASSHSEGPTTVRGHGAVCTGQDQPPGTSPGPRWRQLSSTLLGS